MIERLMNPPVLDRRRAQGCHTGRDANLPRPGQQSEVYPRHVDFNDISKSDGVLGLTNDEKKALWPLRLEQ